MDEESKHKAVCRLLQLKVLLGPDLLQELTEEDVQIIVDSLNGAKATVITKDVKKVLESGKADDLNWVEFEQGRVRLEKGGNPELYNRYMDFLRAEEVPAPEREPEPVSDSRLRVLFTYNKESTKREVSHFVSYFNHRFKMLESLLSSRQEMQNLTSISRVLQKKDKENLAIVGMVQDKSITKNGNLMLTLEDQTGLIKVLVSKSKPELFDSAKDIVLDEVLGVTGVNGDRIIFANNVIWPDVPIVSERKHAPDEAYVVFLSDLHIGSNNFLPEEFNRFLNWISGESGNPQQREVASKVKYIFIVGDIVDGVGIYPGQDNELDILDIYAQYEEAAKLLSRIPKHINVIICPGNHDTGRIAEPQLKLGHGFSEALSKIPNATLVSNPSLINIHASESFSGFDVLLYHGYSFDYYVANVDSIRTQGGYDRADLIMKYLLQRRHLAPTHGSSLYIPDADTDPLTIATIPDFLVTGHIHKCSVASYRGITLICGSCFQSITDFQKKVGHHPEPARVPVVNLQTREIKIMRF